MSELISVVIPTHNSVEFIGKTLESVFKQTVLPSEVVIVDDASTDGTNDLVASIAQQAPVPVRLHRLPTNSGGPARPLNVGIGVARGPLIASLDHDDLMLPEKLELQAECFTRDNSLGLVLSSYSFFRDGEKREVKPLDVLRSIGVEPEISLGDAFYRVNGRDCYKALIYKFFGGSCSNFLFPKGVWERCGGFDEKLTNCIDYGFLQAIAKDYNIGIVDNFLFYYNWRADSLYKTSRRLSVRSDHLHVFRNFETTLLSKPWQSRLRGRLVRELLGVGHLLRKEGRFAESLRYYAEGFYRGGIWTLF